MGKYVGIDLGTTFSAIAYIDENGQPQIIPNQQGDRTTASTVLFGGKKPIVGKSAKAKSVSDPKNYEAFVKRHMGDKSYTFTSKNGDTFNPETVSALILGKLKEDAEYFLNDEIIGAVITVPAYFNDPQRRATKDAAELAGLNVLDIINEPTAAAIAFGISKNIQKKQRIMVYDFGGGTFDVSILDIDEDTLEVVATNGDHQLGGYNIDKEIVDYVIEEATDAGFDIEHDVKAMQQLMIQAEEAKKILSFDETAPISIYVKGEEFEIEIDREFFENELIEDIVGRTLGVMQNTIDDAKLNYSDIDKIILVGGSTRIPKVRNEIEKETGIKPSSEVHPDEAVAIGAAFHAVDVAKRKAEGTFDSGVNNNEESFEIDTESIPDVKKNYTFKDVTSHGIGIVASIDNVLRNSVIMPKNTIIPEVCEKCYCTEAPNQDAIFLQVTQGDEEELEYVTIIGEAKLKLKPREYRVQLKVKVTCDSDAIIHVHAFDFDDSYENNAGIPLGEIKINREKFNMTEKELQEAKKHIRQLNIGD